MVTLGERPARARPTRAAPETRHPNRVAVALALGVVALSFVLAAAGHAAGIARTDDWAFARVAFEWSRTGHLRLAGWGQMNLVGLAAYAQPWIRVFGAHQWVLDVAGGALVALGLVAAHALARVWLDLRQATVAVLCVVVCAGFLRDATTFMTDGPALALGTCCLLAGTRVASAAGRRRARWLVIALALGFWAFTVRELAIAAPAAVLVTELAAATGTRARARVAIAGAAFAAACAAFFVWRHALPGQQPYWGVPPFFVIVELVVNSVFTLALGVAPALAVTATRWWRPGERRARNFRLAGMGAGVVLALVPVWYAHWSWGGGYSWLLGDYLDRRGINAGKVLAGSRPVVLPGPLWVATTVLAIAAAVVACGLVAEHVAYAWAPRVRGAARDARAATATARTTAAVPRLLVAHLAIGAAVLTVAAARNAVVFDRYLWPLVLSGSILVLHRTPALRSPSPPTPGARPVPVAALRAGSATVVALVAVVALVITANSDAFDGARWRAGERAVASGAEPATVDAGFEWVGAHAGVPADVRTKLPTRAYRTWWAGMFPSPTLCVVVSSSPLHDARLTLVRTERWRPLLFFGHARLDVYETAEQGCARR